MHLIMADQGGSSSSSVMRDYRKGNWTVSETMVLIEAKKMDDERRMKRSTGESSAEAGRSSKPTELRWKWVEDYCWRKGCLRSQNQCNDKWDNLMRDYKKVRDYERRRIAERSGGGGGDGNTTVRSVEGSYWELEKNERKEKNLPSNMLPQIFQALEEVVEKKGTHHKIANVGGGGGGSLASIPNIGYAVQPLFPPLLQHHQVSGSIPLLPLPPPPPPPPSQQPPMAQPAAPLSYQPHLTLPTVGSDTDTSDYSDSPAKRRRRGRGGSGAGGEGTSGTANTSSSNHEVGSAIYKSGSIIAEALQGCDERQERRHRDLLSLHERRLKIEETKTEINRQGINGLVDAINKLANSILTLVSHSKNQSSSK
ncbi:hypothetical protein HS088_TW13G01158 [Tripterygium wilfordii]|uniref:Myb-like domain-containing protein n=1 Tax=Tripterygium wilfordii TaxID=458696 RepID=A0A7J7CVW3_TRIWF|nr:uncharacterized protein LOC120013935 [Tripterygium wilfordii]KAF5738262.1 hypothetical protein HS088_TW13G01158 [Tripterygium wilfordii]